MSELRGKHENDQILNSLAIQWLELSAFTAKGSSSVPGQGKISYLPVLANVLLQEQL